MNRRYTLDENLAAIVATVRLPDETVWHTDQDEDGTVTILLIDSAAIQHAERMAEIGLAGGAGRALHFRNLDGSWSLVSQGRWIG